MQENFGYDGSVRPTLKTVGVEVGRKDGLWGRANLLGGRSHGQRRIWQAAYFWREITLTVVGFYAQSKPV